MIAVSTPSVPFTTIPAPASKPSRYKLNGPATNLSPEPKKGIKIAKKMNGISINARLNKSVKGIFAIAATAKTQMKYPINACQFVIGVETATRIKAIAAITLR